MNSKFKKADIERIKEALALLRKQHRGLYGDNHARKRHDQVINHTFEIENKVDELETTD